MPDTQGELGTLGVLPLGLGGAGGSPCQTLPRPGSPRPSTHAPAPVSPPHDFAVLGCRGKTPFVDDLTCFSPNLAWDTMARSPRFTGEDPETRTSSETLPQVPVPRAAGPSAEHLRLHPRARTAGDAQEECPFLPGPPKALGERKTWDIDRVSKRPSAREKGQKKDEVKDL